VPILSAFDISMRRAIATASGIGFLISLPATAGFLLYPITDLPHPPGNVGAVNLIAFAVIIAVSFLTTPLGVRLAHSLDTRPLKALFGGLLILVAINMLIASLNPPWPW
jgi:uncharacterized protein